MRSASVSKMRKARWPAGPLASAAISVSTTGPAASTRSPEKPAAQPISNGAVDRFIRAVLSCAANIRTSFPSVKSKVRIRSSNFQITMAIPDLSTRQLRAFAALADQRNFTRAAERCHLSQPAFSTLIRTLEHTVGARLFDRDTRSVQLTPEGQQFESSARRLLDDMQDLIGDLADRVERRKGRVSVAALPSLAAGWLPEILAEFMRSWPGISVELHDALSDACIAHVRNHEADFALSASGALSTSAADLRSTKLCSDRFHLVCRADHPLAAVSRPTPSTLLRFISSFNRRRQQQRSPGARRRVASAKTECSLRG